MEEDMKYDRKMVHHELGETQDDFIGDSVGTVCVLWKGSMRYVGLSRCHTKDQFNRKLGHKIAYGRAFQALKEATGWSQERRPDEADRLYTFFNYTKGCVGIDVPCERGEVDSYLIPSFLLKETKKEKEV